MIYIDSNCGRIGELWWVNSDPKVVPLDHAWSGFHLLGVGVRWGTFGFGRDIRIHYEPINND